MAGHDARRPTALRPRDFWRPCRWAGYYQHVPMLRAEVSPNLFRWARDRAGIPLAALMSRFSKLAEWESGASKPTLKQLEAMVYACQERQSWYREFAATAGVEPCPFVGSATTSSPVVEVAERMRKTLNFDLDRRNDSPTWTEALRDFIDQAEAAGVLVMCSGVVLNNNGRPLDPDEFRGFTIADALAPLVFINGADTKAAQTFTLAHELVHLWIGQSGVTDATIRQVPSRQTERWCNQVAAEFLVPLAVLRADYQKSNQLDREVSSLVILRRLHDAGFISKPFFAEAFDAELDRLRERAKGSGGSFYLTQAVRASKRFTRALLASTLEGQTLFRDAMRLLGVSKVETLHSLSVE